jgi:hypothetical protein
MSDSIIPAGLLRSLSYSIPIDGVIRTGSIVLRGGKRLPQQDDEFTITTKYNEDGAWVPHLIDEALREHHAQGAEGKLRRIPIVIAFDMPELTINEQFAAFTRQGRPLCVGDGCSARRRENGHVAPVDCAGPDDCAFGAQNRCDAFFRLIVQIDHPQAQGQHFILRSGSINAVSDCRTTLESLKHLYGGLAGLPMWLTLEAKSSAMSNQSVFWHASLRPRLPLIESARVLKEFQNVERQAGLNRTAFEQVLLALRANGAFADPGDNGDQIEDLILGRFAGLIDGDSVQSTESRRPSSMVSIAEAVEQLAQRLRRGASNDAPAAMESVLHAQTSASVER